MSEQRRVPRTNTTTLPFQLRNRIRILSNKNKTLINRNNTLRAQIKKNNTLLKLSNAQKQNALQDKNHYYQLYNNMRKKFDKVVLCNKKLTDQRNTLRSTELQYKYVEAREEIDLLTSQNEYYAVNNVNLWKENMSLKTDKLQLELRIDELTKQNRKYKATINNVNNVINNTQ